MTRRRLESGEEIDGFTYLGTVADAQKQMYATGRAVGKTRLATEFMKNSMKAEDPDPFGMTETGSMQVMDEVESEFDAIGRAVAEGATDEQLQARFPSAKFTFEDAEPDGATTDRQIALEYSLLSATEPKETVDQEIDRLIAETAPGGKRHNPELEAEITNVLGKNPTLNEAGAWNTQAYDPLADMQALHDKAAKGYTVGVDTASGPDQQVTVYRDNSKPIDEDKLHIFQCNSCAELMVSVVPDSAPICISCTATRIFGKGIPLVPDEEEVGRLVRQIWVGYIRETVENPDPKKVASWEELPEDIRQVDQRIGIMLLQVFHAAINASGAGKLLQSGILLNLLQKEQQEAEEREKQDTIDGMVVGTQRELQTSILELIINEEAALPGEELADTISSLMTGDEEDSTDA